MSIDLNALKKNSSASFAKLMDKVNQDNKFKSDARYWHPTTDSKGEGGAIIRFLPPVADEEVPFVKYYAHSFKGPTGRWYSHRSLTTIGMPDPVGELNSELWNANTDDNSPTKKMARAQKRSLRYISNIYVIRDPANADAEGHVFLYQYGRKIWGKINDLMHTDELSGKQPINPFDFWKGASFVIRITRHDGFRNYDSSAFSEPAPLFDSDDKINAVWQQEYKLAPENDASKYESYETLRRELYAVIGNTARIALGHEPANALAPAAPAAPAASAAVPEPAPAPAASAWQAETEDSASGDAMEQWLAHIKP